MSHGFKPVTTGEEIQVAILDELQKISSLLEPPREPADMEPKPGAGPARDAPASSPTTGEPEKKPDATRKAPAKKAATRKRVTGQ